MTEYTISDAKILLRRELELQRKYAGKSGSLHIPGLLGGVGIGKTSIAYEMAEAMELSRIVKINCGEESDPTELMGMWRVDRTGAVEGTRMVKTKAGMQEKPIKVEHTEWILNLRAALACAVPTLLVLDDIDKAEGIVQNALLQICGERRIRDTRLHRNTLIIAAGNRVTDDIYANEISESLRTRITFFEVAPNIDDFIEYGRSTGEIHSAILGFLAKNPQLLHKREDGKLRFPTPRNWREVSQHFSMYPVADEKVGSRRNWEEAVDRKCGEGIGAKFWAWHEILSKIDVEHVLRYGTNIPSDDMSQFATVWAVMDHLHALKKLPASAPGLDHFIANLPAEMRVAAWAHMAPKVRPWFSKNCPTAAALINQSAVSIS